MAEFDGIRIYAAGKIRKNDWRHEIVHLGESPEDLEHPEMTPWPDEMPINSLPGATYLGPHFLSDDHGCYHGPNLHGVAAGGRACGAAYAGLTRPEVVKRCLSAIERCTHVFAWIENTSAFGSLVEIGYARALGKQVHVYLLDEQPDLVDLWFAGQIATACTWVSSPSVAWQDFGVRLRRFQALTSAQPRRAEVGR